MSNGQLGVFLHHHHYHYHRRGHHHIAIGQAQTNGSNKNCRTSHACKYYRSYGIEGEINSSQTMQNIPLGFVRVTRSNIALQENLHFGISG